MPETGQTTTDSSPPTLSKFGYAQELHRSMTLLVAGILLFLRLTGRSAELTLEE